MHANRSRTRLCQKEGDNPESPGSPPNDYRGVLPVQDDAAVAVTDLAVHEAGEVGSEEQHHLRRLAGLGGAAQRNTVDDALRVLVRKDRRHVGKRERRAHSVAADAELTALLGDRLGKAVDTGLGARVGRGAEQAAADHDQWQQQQQQTAAPAQARPPKTVREQQYTQRDYEDSDELPAWMLERLKEMKDDA